MRNNLEQLPILGKGLRRRREATEADEVLYLTRAFAEKTNEQLAQLTGVSRFTKGDSRELLLEKHFFGLTGPSRKKISVALWIPHMDEVLDSKCIITEEQGFRVLTIHQRRTGETVLDFGVKPSLSNKQKVVLAHGAKIAFLNTILLTGFDRPYTERLMIRQIALAQTYNASLYNKENQSVSIIKNNPDPPKIRI